MFTLDFSGQTLKQFSFSIMIMLEFPAQTLKSCSILKEPFHKTLLTHQMECSSSQYILFPRVIIFLINNVVSWNYHGIMDIFWTY